MSLPGRCIRCHADVVWDGKRWVEPSGKAHVCAKKAA
jgi:hypothetical protein